MNLRELAPEQPAVKPVGTLSVSRNSASQTLARIWPDTVRRLIPFGAAALAYARLRTDGVKRVGLAAHHSGRDVALGLVFCDDLGGPLTAAHKPAATCYNCSVSTLEKGYAIAQP